MKKDSLIFFLFFLFGLVTVPVYAMQLSYGFEEYTGFLIETPIFYTLLIVTALFVLLSGVYSGATYGGMNGWSPTVLLFDNSLSMRILRICSAIIVFIGSLLGFVRIAQMYSAINLMLAVFSLLSAISIIIIALGQSKGAFSNLHYLVSVIPIIWACACFVLEFKNNSANPVVWSYGFELFSALFMMLGFYKFSAMFYRNRTIKWYVFFSLCAVFFAVMCYGGRLFANLLGNYSMSIEEVSYSVTVLGGALFLLTNAVAVKNNLGIQRAKFKL